MRVLKSDVPTPALLVDLERLEFYDRIYTTRGEYVEAVWPLKRLTIEGLLCTSV